MSGKNRGGESQGVREVMDKLTKRLKDGGMPIEKARTNARKSALRNERGALRQKK